MSFSAVEYLKSQQEKAKKQAKSTFVPTEISHFERLADAYADAVWAIKKEQYTIDFSENPDANLSAKTIKIGNVISKIVWEIGDLEISLNEAQADILISESRRILDGE